MWFSVSKHKTKPMKNINEMDEEFHFYVFWSVFPLFSPPSLWLQEFLITVLINKLLNRRLPTTSALGDNFFVVSHRFLKIQKRNSGVANY